MSSARNCSMIAKRPVFCAISHLVSAKFWIHQSRGRRQSSSPPVAFEPVLQDLDYLLTGQVGVRSRAARNERVIDDHRGLLPKIPVVTPFGSSGVAQDIFERIRGWSHIEVDTHKARAVLVVILFAVAGDVFAPDNGFAIFPVAREGEAGHAVALSPNGSP